MANAQRQRKMLDYEHDDFRCCETQMTDENTKPSSPMRRALRARDFRLLLIGQGTSLLGDQFYFIALPWLVLQTTGSGLAVGTVLALEGIPRALFMLLGGAITDRFSARAVMLVSDMIRLMLTVLLAVMVFAGWMELWMLYTLALVFGLVDGFFMPASTSIVPHILEKEDLQAGNALSHGMAQLSTFLGPVLAGGLIAWFANSPDAASAGGSAVPGAEGIGLAFAVDGVTFLVSVVTLWLMRVRGPQVPGEEAEQQAHLLSSIRDGLNYVWSDPLLRTVFVLMATINFLVVGPFSVGIPVLSDTRLAEGAAAFGIISSAWGGGSLLGYALAGAMPRSDGMRMIIPAVFALFGIGLAALGFSTSTILAAVVVLVMGVGGGYISILMLTWMQKRTPKDMLGRVMSLAMFASMGLVPLSQAMSGAAIGVSLVGLYIGAGLLLVLVALRSAVLPEMRTFTLDLDD